MDGHTGLSTHAEGLSLGTVLVSVAVCVGSSCGAPCSWHLRAFRLGGPSQPSEPISCPKLLCFPVGKCCLPCRPGLQTAPMRVASHSLSPGLTPGPHAPWLMFRMTESSNWKGTQGPVMATPFGTPLQGISWKSAGSPGLPDPSCLVALARTLPDSCAEKPRQCVCRGSRLGA